MSNPIGLRVLIIDDDLGEDLDHLRSMFSRATEGTGLACEIDVAPTWNARQPAPRGLELFCQHHYDLVVLDLVFKGQPDQGAQIYEAIRSELAGYDIAQRPRTSPSVPILLLTNLDKNARPMLAQISASAGFALTYILCKEDLRAGRADPVMQALNSLWAGSDAVMHVLIPSGPNRVVAVADMMIAFGLVGAPAPPLDTFVRRIRQSFRLIRDALDPDILRGKKEWTCEVVSTDQPLVQSAYDLNQLFAKKMGRARLIHQHPSGTPGWKVIDGVVEVRLLFADPTLFGMNENSLVLSRRPGGTLFVSSGFWVER